MEKKVFDCSNVSLECLKVMYSQLNGYDADFEDRKESVLDEIIKRYFEDKESLDLYHFLILHDNLAVTKNLDKAIDVFLNEFKTRTINTMPEGYEINFIVALAQVLDNIQDEVNAEDYTTTLDMEKVKVLMKNVRLYLSDEDPNACYGLKRMDLIRLNMIYKDLLEDLSYLERAEGREDYTIVDREDIGICDFSKYCSNFDKYSDEDKKFLVNYALNNYMVEDLRDIDSVVAFDYFKKNMDKYDMKIKNVNPFYTLSSSINSIIMSKDFKELQKWFDYFGVNDFEELMQGIENWYMSFSGSTEIGYKCYKEDMLKSYFDYDFMFYTSDNSKEGFYRYMYKYMMAMMYEDRKELQDILDDLNVITLVRNEQWRDKYEMKNTPYICNGKMVEYIKKREVYDFVCCRYIDVINRYRKRFFIFSDRLNEDTLKRENYIMFSEVLSEEENKVLTEIISIAKDIRIAPKDISIMGGFVFSNSDTDKIEFLAKGVMRVILLNQFLSPKDKGWFKEMYFDKGDFMNLCHFLRYFEKYGFSINIQDFLLALFNAAKDDLDFSKQSDLQLAFEKGDMFKYKKVFNAFYKKFEEECPECVVLLNSYVGDTKPSNDSIQDFIKAYYQLR